MIVDFHAHTSNYPMRNLHTASASIATLEDEARRYGIYRIVLLATYFPLKGTGVHNLDLLERIQGHPLFIPFGSLDVMKHLDAGLVELELLARDRRIAGIKLYPGYQGFEPSDPRLESVYAIAENYRLPIMLHGGDLHHCCPPTVRGTESRPCGLSACALPDYQEFARPQYVEKPARERPNVKFVVAHLANPYFSELRGVMTRCPNVFTDMSGQLVSGSSEDTSGYREHIVSEIKRFLSCPDGGRRVLFGSDFPIQGYKDSLDFVKQLRLHDQDLDNLLAQNALRVLDPNHLPQRSY